MESEVNFSICISCVDDEILEEIIKEKDETHNCSVCGERNIAIGCEDLAKLLKEVIEENFCLGSYQPYFINDSDRPDMIQSGTSLNEVIDEIMGCEIPFGNELVNLIIDSESWHPDDFDSNFFSEEENYVENRYDNLNLQGQWYQLIEELKTQRRFFSDNARNLFQFLFKDLNKLWCYIPVENKNKKCGFSQEKRNVIEILPINTKIYRARRANSLRESERYILNPIQELAPPSMEYAQQGRMNAKGISNFYGAFDLDTCIAEMRPSIGSYIVVGEFETTSELKILNFEYLENSYGHLSYFASDYQDQFAHRRFLKKIHKLISSPIIHGHEDEYLITQVLAEYLAYMHPENFDGISFKSTQSEIGTNIVLFPKKPIPVEIYSFDSAIGFFEKEVVSIEDKLVETKDELSKFKVRYVSESASLHQTQKVAYTSIKKEFDFIQRSGKLGIALLEELIDEEY
ncbi:RES domain-containing protein [Acinetobacter beijerinckii]|uniref:RES family NAD+ phosphorylase n=1 Tax=Acinetobacter beijerinckii TaxID=262668 RepID=UPI0023DDF1A2|nr:RES family NAD+ phosphorylase [Acinetobacter beijerinckii]MDF2417327.1 RES domain-containing protein [Acinetobacter beijerinckii]